jgi:polar amino acid transport system substrate-binding protein
MNPVRLRTSRWTSVVSVMCLSMSLAACGSSSDDSASPTKDTPADADPAVVALLPDAVKEKGMLEVGMEAQYPPFDFYDTDNTTIVGIDPDIAAGLAELMGLELSLNDAAFDSIIPALAGGRYDLGISAFTVTEERMETVDFVTYYYEGDGLMVPAGNPEDLAIDESLCGVKVAVLKGSTQALRTVPDLDKQCAAAGDPAVDATVVPGSNDLGLALSSGRADGVLTDGSNAAYTAKLSDGKFEIAPGPAINPAPFGIASKKASGLEKAVQKALEIMLANGSYKEVLDKWDVSAGAIESPEINEVAN